MRKISLWAKHNPWTARIIIVLCYLPINVSGILTGDLLFDFGLRLSDVFLWAVIVLFMIAVFNYPSLIKQKNQSINSGYNRRKAADMALIVCTYLMICCTGNQLNNKILFQSGLSGMASYTSRTTNDIAASTSPVLRKGESSPVKANKKEVRKKWKHYIKEVRKLYKSANDGEKALLIALSILAAVGLFLLLATLSCSIACGGAEGLAYVVFFGGTIAIVFGLVKVIKRIVRGRPKEQNHSKKDLPSLHV